MVITTRHVTNIETFDKTTNNLIADALLSEKDAELETVATSRSNTAKQQHDARERVKQANKVGPKKIKPKNPQLSIKAMRRSHKSQKEASKAVRI